MLAANLASTSEAAPNLLYCPPPVLPKTSLRISANICADLPYTRDNVASDKAFIITFCSIIGVCCSLNCFLRQVAALARAAYRSTDYNERRPQSR